MGFLDTLLGRTKQVKPNLDVLFAIPSAALTLRAGLGLTPSGAGAVCFKTAEGQAAASAQADALALLDTDPAEPATVSRDEYGYTWVTVRRSDADLSALVTDLHAVNTTLTDAGFGPTLLCTVIGFTGTIDGRPHRLGLVYLFKRGTVYPFAPTDGHTRDTTLDLPIRAQLTDDLPMEDDLGRWFPIWTTPAL